MSFGLICDTLHAHRKVAKAGLEAMGMWVVALSWSKDKKTNGFIPADRPLALADDDADAAERCIARLVKAKLWEPTDGGWVFHDWANYQTAETSWSKTSYPAVIARDGMRCRYCALDVTPDVLHIDHVHPRCQGGGDNADNLVVACRGCNLKKGGRTPEQAGMALLSVPQERA